MKLYKEIARVLGQKNKSLNVIEKELTLFKEVLPIRLNPVIKDGNRIEAGCVISLKSTKKRIVIDTLYWHTNDSDETSRCTAHQVVITPSFEDEINIRITGKNEDNVKEYLHNIFRESLMSEIVCNF
ncbi:MAG: hypothetical protein ACOVOQ_08395 [Flavobacterium sp.]